MTRKELIELGKRIIKAEVTESELDELYEVFSKNVPYPERANLFFYPENYNAIKDNLNQYRTTVESIVSIQSNSIIVRVSKKISNCTECESEYYSESSKMVGLCAECSYQLYDYKNCEHEFKNDRCVKCYWNGNVSEYLKSKKNR